MNGDPSLRDILRSASDLWDRLVWAGGRLFDIIMDTPLSTFGRWAIYLAAVYMVALVVPPLWRDFLLGFRGEDLPSRRKSPHSYVEFRTPEGFKRYRPAWPYALGRRASGSGSGAAESHQESHQSKSGDE